MKNRRDPFMARRAGLKWLCSKDDTNIETMLIVLQVKARAANSARAALRLWELHDWLLRC